MRGRPPFAAHALERPSVAAFTSWCSVLRGVHVSYFAPMCAGLFCGTITAHMSGKPRIANLVVVPRTTTEWLAANAPKLRQNELGLNTDTGEERWGPGYWGSLTSHNGQEHETVQVVAATTANITIATALNAGDTLDGVTLAAGDKVLVKNQSTASQNGIYTVAASPARNGSFDSWNEHLNALVKVNGGSTNGGKYFRCTVSSGGTLDTTDITFVEVPIRGNLKLGTRSQLATLNAGGGTEAGTGLVLLERADGSLYKLSLTNLKASLNALP